MLLSQIIPSSASANEDADIEKRLVTNLFTACSMATWSQVLRIQTQASLSGWREGFISIYWHSYQNICSYIDIVCEMVQSKIFHLLVVFNKIVSWKLTLCTLSLLLSSKICSKLHNAFFEWKINKVILFTFQMCYTDTHVLTCHLFPNFQKWWINSVNVQVHQSSTGFQWSQIEKKNLPALISDCSKFTLWTLSHPYFHLMRTWVLMSFHGLCV